MNMDVTAFYVYIMNMFATKSKTDSKEQSKTPKDIVGRTEPRPFRVISDAGFDYYLNNFKPNIKDDIIICTIPKAGQTWMALTCHLLRGGDMNFRDLNQVVPWHQLGWDMDWDPASKVNNMQSKLRPRFWKSHQLISAEKKTARYITTIRHPASILKSWLSFMKRKKLDGYVGRNADQLWYECPNLFRDSMGLYASPYDYLCEAYLLRDHPDVLVVCYEDLLEDFSKMLPKIARFIGMKSVSHDFLMRVIAMTSREESLKHVEKFDECWCSARLQKIGRTKYRWETVPKVTSKPHPGPSEKVQEEVERFMATKFSERGLDEIKTYDDLANAIRKSWEAKPMPLRSFSV